MRREHDFTGDYIIRNAETMREQYIVITKNSPGTSNRIGHVPPSPGEPEIPIEVSIQTVPFRFLLPGPPSLRSGVSVEKVISRGGKDLTRHLPVSTV